MGDGCLSVYTVESQHSKLRKLLKLPQDFVIHGLRHTMLTRLGEASSDPFVLMRIAGHSTVTVSQRYVHPSAEAQERAFERLEALNDTMNRKALGKPTVQEVTTISTTPAILETVPSMQVV
jgi:integrase